MIWVVNFSRSFAEKNHAFDDIQYTRFGAEWQELCEIFNKNTSGIFVEGDK